MQSESKRTGLVARWPGQPNPLSRFGGPRLKIMPEESMTTTESLLPEFDREMACTRRTLERIPEDKLAWKPHEKSMLLARLAGHIAELPGFGAAALTTEKVEFAERSAGYKPTVADSQQHVLGIFDKNV